MKLYATVTSERASKGQGGKVIDIAITCANEVTELNDLVMRVRSYTDRSGGITLRVTSQVSEQDMDVRLPERYTKGNKQKGETPHLGHEHLVKDGKCSIG